MKGLYWRPSSVPRLVLVVITILAIAAVLSVEIFKAKKRQPWYKEKFQASLTMKNGMEVIKKHRISKYDPVDKAVDPADSGMIGIPQSPITSNFGNLLAKQSTMNPNWAAVLVEMLKGAGLKEGDTVAMGLSGSFPSLNLAAYAAAGAMKLKVIAISSVSASTWGANIPGFTWLDMESLLHKEGLISTRSVAASYGGREDLALGRSKTGKEMLRELMVRNGYTPLEFETTRENIDERMAIYEKFSEGRRIAAYMNVGGGTVSVGSAAAKKMFQPGLNMKAPPGALSIDGVMTRFAKRGVP
ncbi:MAG: poly-gamma-glutamate system protein, partial [Pseudomonadota bacterium]